MAAAKTNGALDGIKVVDLSRVLGGPMCGQALADHGAEVIKVEPPRGDETRAWGPPFVDGAAAYYLGANRNKRGIAIDLSRPQGRDLLLRFLADSDVLVENFRTGTLEKWGLGYDQVLAERFPRLIHCRISGFGGDGPLGGYPGYDAVVQAMTGLMSINGTPDGGTVRMGIPIVDLAAGLNAMQGVLLALLERQRSGRGQFVEVSLYNTAVSLLHPHAANWFLSGRVPTRTGNAHPNVVPYDKFETATGEIFIGIGNDGQFRKLCALLGDDDLAADPRFKSNAERGANRAELTATLQGLMRAADGKALCTDLLETGVPAGPVHDIAEVLEHPHTIHNEMVVASGGYRGTGIPVKLSRSPGTMRLPPPTFSQHAREILAEYGIDDDGFDALVAAGVVITEIPAR